MGVRRLYQMNATVHNQSRSFVPQSGHWSVKWHPGEGAAVL